MSLKFFDNKRKHNKAAFVSVDKYCRLFLNKATRDLLNIEGRAIELYVGYDPVNKRIGVAKPEQVRLTDTEPMKFDAQRAYTYAKGFLNYFQIPCENHRYYYKGKDTNGVFLFQLKDFTAPDDYETS